MTTETIFVGINDEIIELTGSEKEAFVAERKEAHDASVASKNALIDRESSRQSALAKLAALGLTDEEIAAL